MTHTYTTKEIAAAIGVHENTVRFYEEIGFLTKPERRANGYRVYTGLQLEECRLIRLAMRAEVVRNGLRKKAVDIVRSCAALDFDGALSACGEYRAMLENEIRSARAAIASVEASLENAAAASGPPLTRREAAKALDVTAETLRTWERSGLICAGRDKRGYRVYSPQDMERLNIIRTLRCGGYSLSSILRLLNRLDGHAAESVEHILNTPGEDEDIVSVCDRLILSLEGTLQDALTLTEMVESINKNFKTLQ